VDADPRSLYREILWMRKLLESVAGDDVHEIRLRRHQSVIVWTTANARVVSTVTPPRPRSAP
jgi:hypothetical protein